jgi:hypothetical protein
MVKAAITSKSLTCRDEIIASSNTKFCWHNQLLFEGGLFSLWLYYDQQMFYFMIELIKMIGIGHDSLSSQSFIQTAFLALTAL